MTIENVGRLLIHQYSSPTISRRKKKTFKTKLCAENGSVTSMKQLSQYF